MDLADHQMHGFRRGHDGHAHALRRLRQFARTRIAVAIPATAAETTVAISPATGSALRAEFTASRTTAARIAPVVTTVVAPRFPTVVTTSPVIAIPTLAGSFVVTGLR
jgi:hypothetical protein